MDSRLTSALVLYAFLVLGVFLLVAPWTPLWQEVSLLLLPIGWADWFRSGWARGVASALGALDLFVAVQLVGELWDRVREGS